MQSAASQFVVLHHTGIAVPHFDLMLEREPGGMLITWRCPSWPVIAATAIVPLKDHRRDFLEYEGPLSGERGTVRRVARGRCGVRWLSDSRITISFDDGIHRSLNLEQIADGKWSATPGGPQNDAPDERPRETS